MYGGLKAKIIKLQYTKFRIQYTGNDLKVKYDFKDIFIMIYNKYIYVCMYATQFLRYLT